MAVPFCLDKFFFSDFFQYFLLIFCEISMVLHKSFKQVRTVHFRQFQRLLEFPQMNQFFRAETVVREKIENKLPNKVSVKEVVTSSENIERELKVNELPSSSNEEDDDEEYDFDKEFSDDEEYSDVLGNNFENSVLDSSDYSSDSDDVSVDSSSSKIVKNMDDIMSARVNNTLALANKQVLTSCNNSWHNLMLEIYVFQRLDVLPFL